MVSLVVSAAKCAFNVSQGETFWVEQAKGKEWNELQKVRVPEEREVPAGLPVQAVPVPVLVAVKKMMIYSKILQS